ncbi:hypothetical protein Nepgr_005792 [Nepenthes gracilis]|uniref:CCHC-type domain-containing protein n=1 Tax=Nepenthes gracilis TaxID=150966 RepID=A0AAD3S3U3_NEPGR|nr:hypothetical protein Nepgr_005792 [Nepenthes gracilis]
MYAVRKLQKVARSGAEHGDLGDAPAAASCGGRGDFWRWQLEGELDCHFVSLRLQPTVVLTLEGELPDDETEEGELIPNEDAVCNSSHLHDSVDFTETLLVTEKLNHVSEPGENGCMSVQDEIAISYRETHGTSKSGDKRSRIIFDEQHPSVHIQYNSLPRSSKRKLEELLQHWSEWHTRHCSSSHDPNGDLEFGEKTYFPAINVGVEKASPVSFWMDNQTRKPRKDFSPQDDDSVPLYDREYALGLLSVDALSNLEGGLKIQEASRCFNCGSYNHSLKECPKPRDNNAVNSAWKQHKSKRNQTPGSHNSTRYYQSSPGGKYEGLRPGALDAETRKLLGLGELAPPPWLNRMREIGYPPGYLDPEDEDQPSGIVIFADDDENEEQEEGEVLRSNKSKRPKKMGVSFPGINAPIPENADERLWAARPSGSNTFQSRDIVASDSHSRGRSYREQRNARDSRDDGPPGCEPGHSSLTSSYQPRYGGYDSGYPSHSSRGNNPIPRSPTLARSVSNRGRNSPSVPEDSATYSSSYSPFSYTSPSSRLSQQNNGGDDREADYSSWRSGKDDRGRHYSRG